MLYQQALEIRERVLGPEHLNTISRANQLGCILFKKGKYKEAEAMHRRASEGGEKGLGPGHRETVFSLCELYYI